MFRKQFSVGEIGRAQVDVRAWGPDEVPTWVPSWSLRPLQDQRDINFGTWPKKLLAARLCAFLRTTGVQRAYAPGVENMSARVVDPCLLKEKIVLDPEKKQVSLYRDHATPADGVFVPRGHAFVMSGAGCPIIIATGGGYMIVAHAGRDSLIDRSLVEDGVPSRSCQSVVDAIVNAFWGRYVSVHDITMGMVFAIPGDAFDHPFSHPLYGEYNRALPRFLENRWPGSYWGVNGSLFLDLEELFQIQAKQAGVRQIWARYSLSEIPSLCHTRDGGDPSRRNLIIVKRVS